MYQHQWQEYQFLYNMQAVCHMIGLVIQIHEKWVI